MKLSRPIHILASSILLLSLAGCHDSASSPYAPGLGDEEGEITITLRVPVSDDFNPTRSFPTGGEEGDGRENGLDYENAVSDVNIFFFEGDGLNGDPAAPVTGVYVKKDEMEKFIADTDSDPFEKKITIKIKTENTDLEKNRILTASAITFITVLNAGEDLSENLSTLKQLREYTAFSSSSRREGNSYGNFIMTTAYDAPSTGIITLGNSDVNVGSNRLVPDKNAPEGKGWKGETTVQRLCARVDLMYAEANEVKNELIYTTDAGNKIHITNLLPVNFMTQPSYLIRKTTSVVPQIWSDESFPGTITWGGMEKTADNSDIPTNYVIEPTTIAKANGTKNVTSWYGNSAAVTVASAISKAANGTLSNYTSRRLTRAEANGCDRVTIIGYPDENIQSPSCYSSDFISGIAFRAVFQPVKIMRPAGDTFSEFTISDAEWNTLTSKTFWRYQPSAPATGITDANALYFISEEDVKAYQAAHPSELASITKYENGVCYYNIWLRHYNNEEYKNENSDPKSSYPMEFAVVRNNLYRVALSFTGPGDPIPTLREPDTMMSRIFVRNWNMREEKNPLQF